MRVVIIGQKWLGEQLFRLCQARGDDIAAVLVPQNDCQLTNAAQSDGIPVAVIGRRVVSTDIPASPDAILCAHNHAFIPADVRGLARFGALGYHPSLLPRHRGRDAIRWAIHMGDKVTGGTLYWLDDGADTGSIAAQDWCWIKPTDTAQSMWRDTLAPMGIRLFSQVLNQLDCGVVTAIKQSEQLATFEPTFTSFNLSGGK